MKKILTAVFLLVLFSSCIVTKKKYDLAENGRISAIQRGDSLNGELINSRSINDNLNEELADFQRQINQQRMQIKNLTADTLELGKAIRDCRSVVGSKMTEQQKLNALLQQKMDELNKREEVIRELQDMISAQQAKVQSLLNNVKNALLGFSSDELTVVEKDGKVYIAMSDKLLFQSGRADVDKRGKEALAKLAEVLNKQVDIDIFIEGHTDSKPINTAQFKDNWDLSVIRATSVVRILTKEYGVNPLQILPSGRGEFYPVATNDTADGRTLNRRTEIILAPKLDKLLELLK